MTVLIDGKVERWDDASDSHGRLVEVLAEHREEVGPSCAGCLDLLYSAGFALGLHSRERCFNVLSDDGDIAKRFCITASA